MLRAQILEKLEHVFNLARHYHASIDEIFDLNDIEIQTRLSPVLRERVVSFLREDSHPIAKGFRDNYELSHGQTYVAYLDKQAKSGEWSSDLEAIVLGYLLGLKIEVTNFTSKTAFETFSLDTTVDDGAPVLALLNCNNSHWFFDKSTQSDGNCLYNTLAQWLRRVVLNQSLEADRTVVSEYFLDFEPSDVFFNFDQPVALTMFASPVPQRARSSEIYCEHDLRDWIAHGAKN